MFAPVGSAGRVDEAKTTALPIIAVIVPGLATEPPIPAAELPPVAVTVPLVRQSFGHFCQFFSLTNMLFCYKL